MAGFQQGPQEQYQPQRLDDEFLPQYRNEIQNIYGWLRRAMEARNSPNYAQNGDFTFWSRGPTQAPDGFYRDQSGVTVSRGTGTPEGVGGNFASIVRAGGSVQPLGITRSFPSFGTTYYVAVMARVISGFARLLIVDDMGGTKSVDLTTLGAWRPMVIQYETSVGASFIKVALLSGNTIVANPSEVHYAGVRIYRGRDALTRSGLDTCLDQIPHLHEGKQPTTITRNAEGIITAAEFRAGGNQNVKRLVARDVNGFLASINVEYPVGTLVSVSTMLRNADRSLSGVTVT